MDTIEIYKREVCRRPILPREEEADLVRQCREGSNPLATQRLVEANLRLVLSVALEYRHHCDLSDLVQEGNIGLLKAIENLRKFDPARGHFGAFAECWIRAAIWKYMLENAIPLAMSAPRRDRQLFCAIARANASSGLAVDHLAEVLASNAKAADLVPLLDVSLATEDEAIDGGTGGAADADDAINAAQIRGRLHALVELFEHELTSREREIFRARWLTETPSPLQELGRRHGLHYSRISKIETKVLRRLREFLQTRQLGAALGAC
jgi:RNA polymerase sigma-32 factor